MSVIKDIESGKLEVQIVKRICKIDDVIGLVEVRENALSELLRLAELGELAVEAMKIDSSNFRCNGLVGIEDNYDGIEVCSMGDYEEGCPWQDFCVKRAEMRGESGERL